MATATAAMPGNSNNSSSEIHLQNGTVSNGTSGAGTKAPSPAPTKSMTLSTTGAAASSPNPKSATLTHPPHHSSATNGSLSYHERNNLRRSFTLPRSLFARKSGQTGPASENKNGSFIRHVFLTLTRSGSTRKSKRQSHNNSNPHNATNGTDSNLILPNYGLPPGFTPGALGLKNQGNTCFMNAIVQCLSHTDALAKYLVTDIYKSDLRRKNWIKAGKGEVTEELATILRSTWLRQNTTVVEEAVSRFKSAVEKGAQQWRGSEQHDAQEFLLWLLDRLHEDLNQAASNKYKQVKSSFGRPEEQVAAEALANHVRCNNSIIQDIFGAQFRSSLTCPGCGRQSATFDPFLCVSLPIPQAKQECPIYVNIVYLSQQPRQVKLGLSSSMNADVRELKQLLSGDTGIAENNILLCEIDGEGFHRTFTETQFVSALSNNEAVYCIETPQVRESNENDGAYLLITWCNILVTNDGNTRVRFGSPYISQLARETGFTDLQKLLLKEMAAILQPGILVAEQKDPVFSIRVLDGSTEGSLVDPLVEHPLYMESVDHALSLCDEDVPPHIKIHLEWTSQDKDRIILDDSESVEEHSSVGQTRLRHSEEAVSSVTLGECFDFYTSAELLSAEDAWHCPHCNRKEQGTLKMIGLWTAPQVLVVHLKRFRQTLKGRQTATKLSTVVDFPVDGLDLTPHVAKRTRATEGNAANGGPVNQVSSPINGCFSLGHWKRASFKKHLVGSNPAHRPPHGSGLVATDDRESLMYDLYAVCNHHGKDVQGGHYTAYCKNPVEGSWWSFDDTRVTRLGSPEDVKTASAYILFYHRKSNGIAPNGYHWCKNLLKKYHKIPPLPLSAVNGVDSISGGQHSSNNEHHQLANNLKNQSVDEVEEMDQCETHNNVVSSENNSESSPKVNGFHNYNNHNGKSSSGSVSSSGSLNGLTSEGSNSSSAPLARMEEIAIGISLGVPKEVQIESTV